jgi:nitrogen regulatory protein P-II 1
MKSITAVIRSFTLDEVRDMLLERGIHGLTVTAVKRYDLQKHPIGIYSGAEHLKELFSKVKVEVVLPEDRLQDAIDVMICASRTTGGGDGKIFVIDIEKVVRIRTGETDINAL